MSLENKANNEAATVTTTAKPSKQDAITNLYVNNLLAKDFREVHEEALEGHPPGWLHDAVTIMAQRTNDSLLIEDVRRFVSINMHRYQDAYSTKIA